MSITPIPLKKTGRGYGMLGKPKTGGRKKGTPNKVSRVPAKRAILAAMRGAYGKAADKKAKELTPLGFMLEVLQNPSQFPFVARQWAANAAAPYVHKKMPIAIEGGDKPLITLDASKLANLSDEQLQQIIAGLVALGVVIDADVDTDVGVGVAK